MDWCLGQLARQVEKGAEQGQAGGGRALPAIRAQNRGKESSQHGGAVAGGAVGHALAGHQVAVHQHH